MGATPFIAAHFDIAQSDCRQARAKRRAHAPKSMASVAAREKMVPAPPPHMAAANASLSHTQALKSRRAAASPLDQASTVRAVDEAPIPGSRHRAV
eukprot:CAMPEP_0181177414 /NCGR_PEP_ID=MMETSP1096-20121128/5148_1 /TAXON_ID=156174 ORGANISM="Chrysochromulina ericina, Strain CCMP281" /NCGR_SAMPLE_ID=MMETSP1096 /ASSEMBLY_ACC=CAM_ASM_000453 /LENGTH=95 /DNA_ID=CAMNT_0023265563 /DNA_START=588 /DNA_END=876 /DNA_ORIENTATION=-